ncbi:hypothetical protein D3C86_1502120 [compost metagenome]
MRCGCVTCTTGMPVAACRILSSTLSWSGDKCTMTTNAIIGLLEVWEKKSRNASMPPAEAPSPTTGKCKSLMATPGLLSGTKGVLDMGFGWAIGCVA